MMTGPILWTARACPFRRAGAYVGLGTADSHIIVMRRLLPRRARVYGGGRVRVRDGEEWPLVYYAVRDPSAARVLPVRDGHGNGNGGRKHGDDDDDPLHVMLVFPSAAARNGWRAAAAGNGGHASLEELERHVRLGPDAGFIVTIGLRPDREAEFHESLVLSGTAPAYAELCERISAAKDQFAG